jgi:hypothetical protein
MRPMITSDSEPLRRKDLTTLVAKFKRRNPSFVDDEPTSREELLAIFRARRSANGNRDILRVCDLLERRTSDVAKVRANQKDIDFQRE